MSHHGNNPFESESDPVRKAMADLRETVSKSKDQVIREMADATGFKGALGTFPDGKLNPGDEGAIQFAIGSEGDKIIIDFGTSVKWVGMTPQQAADLASTLLAEARKLGRKQGKTIALVVT